MRKKGHAKNDEIKAWLLAGIKKGATHCLVICDYWEYEDYPVYIMPDEDPKQKIRIYKQPYPWPERLKEVYNLNMDIEEQLTADSFKIYG